jgi:hypothetical protein
VTLGPWNNLRLLVSYGTGFRGPDARTVADAGPVELTTAQTEDATVRYTLALPGAGPRFIASITGFHTTVDDDEIFDPVRGTTAAVGPTDRLGAMFWGRIQPVAWIDVNAWVAYTRSTVERGALDGQLAAGSPIPYLPALVARLDAAFSRVVGSWRGLPVHVRGGFGASYRGAEALIVTQATEPVVLLDAGAGARLGPVALDVAARNLLDARWHSTDFEYRSTFVQGGVADATPVRHFVAGAPFTLYATLTLSL